MHSAGGWDHPVLRHLRWGFLFTCAVKTTYLWEGFCSEILCAAPIVCCVLRLFFEKIKSSTVPSFLLPLFFIFIIRYPYLYFYETLFGLFFTPTRHTSVLSICASSFNEIKKKKKNLECKQEHQVLFHVLCCFFLTACNKIPPSLPYQGKAIKLFLRSQWITIKHSCNILAWHELCFFFVMSVGVGWVVENFCTLCYICISVAFGKKNTIQ